MAEPLPVVREPDGVEALAAVLVVYGAFTVTKLPVDVKNEDPLPALLFPNRPPHHLDVAAVAVAAAQRQQRPVVVRARRDAGRFVQRRDEHAEA